MGDTALHEKTSIWQRTLAYRENDSSHDARARLRNAYESLRRNVSFIVAQIAKDLPQLTLHDINHLDALWTTADLIAGPEFEITPAEAFVLGGAILLHDAGHALATIKGGVSALTETPEWRDAVASALESKRLLPVTIEKIKSPPPDCFDDILFSTLRALHAKVAETLPHFEFKNEITNKTFYLFEDGGLRNQYKETFARFGRILPGYYSFRMLDRSGRYEKLEDTPLLPISEIGQGVDEVTLHFPTLMRGSKEELQALNFIDRKQLKALFQILEKMNIAKCYLVSGVSSSQCSLPKEFSNEEEFSGIFASLVNSLRDKGFILNFSVENVSSTGLDRASMMQVKGMLDRIVTVTGKRK